MVRMAIPSVKSDGAGKGRNRSRLREGDRKRFRQVVGRLGSR